MTDSPHFLDRVYASFDVSVLRNRCVRGCCLPESIIVSAILLPTNIPFDGDDAFHEGLTCMSPVGFRVGRVDGVVRAWGWGG